MSDERLAPDGVLALLVKAMNKFSERADNGPGVVLTLAGQVVSGKVISHWQWFEDVHALGLEAARHMGRNPDDEPGYEVLFGEFSKQIGEYAKEVAAAKEAAKGLAERYQKVLAEPDTVEFIHLAEARVYSPGSPGGLPGNGMYWRGRLSEIVGWSFGLFENAG